jgi:hypothetical protein
MRRSSGPASASPRGRRIAIILLILLLIALPLYLWPLRGSGTGLPGTGALFGPPRDPRDASAVAHLPADVWDGLMDEGRTGRKIEITQRPGNLTRIAHLEGVPGVGPLDIVSGGTSLPWPRDTLPRPITALFGNGPDQSGDTSSPSAPEQFLAGSPGGEGTGSGNGWGGGSYSGFPNNLGPFNAGGGPGGSGGGGPLFFSYPSDPSAPAPTPEPATILLIGSNVVLLGAASWRRFRSLKETVPSG